MAAMMLDSAFPAFAIRPGPEVGQYAQSLPSRRGQGAPRQLIRTHFSEHTVATHVSKTVRKLGLRSRSRLSAWVADQQIPFVGLEPADDPPNLAGARNYLCPDSD